MEIAFREAVPIHPSGHFLPLCLSGNFLKENVPRTKEVIREIIDFMFSTVKWGYFSSQGLLYPPSGKVLLMHFPRNTPGLQLLLVFCIVRQLNVRKNGMPINAAVNRIDYRKNVNGVTFEATF